MKKLLTLVFFLLSLLTFTFAAGAFSDITDSQTHLCVDTLSFMDVVSGYPDGSYRPNQALTRAEFSKMIIKAINADDLVTRYKNFTIFTDVPYTHWAAPYINVAVSAESIVNGFPDGTFRPDETVTGAQAVTIALRVLGYSVEDIGAMWPQDYIHMADTIGLTLDVQYDANAPLTRGAAAVLIRNMLVTDTKDGTVYVQTIYSKTADRIILSTSATNGKLNANEIITNGSDDEKIVCSKEIPKTLCGLKGILISDSKDTCIGFIPYNYTLKNITVSQTTSSSILTTEGTTIHITPETCVILNNNEYDYSDCWFSIQAGTQLILSQNRSGSIETITSGITSYQASAGPYVITTDYREGINPLGSFFMNSATSKIYKNGSAANLSDIRKYDVAVYNSAADTFQIYNYKLSGKYTDAYPSPSAPTQIEVFNQTFIVLPSAMDDFASLKLGSIITLLLTPDHMVAGALPSSTLLAPQYAILTGYSGKTVTFDIVESTLSLSGSVSGDYSLNISDLVKVYTGVSGNMIISSVNNKKTSGKFDVAKGTINDKQIAPNAVIYEKAGLHGAIARVDMDEIKNSVIPSSKILFIENDYQGRPYIIILASVTGDIYHYGYFDSSGDSLTVTNKDGSKTYTSKIGPLSSTFTLGGVSANTNQDIWAIVPLNKIGTVEKTAFIFNEKVKIKDKTADIADNVSVYSSSTKSYISFEKALSIYDQFEIYTDNDAGKVRFIVAK